MFSPKGAAGRKKKALKDIAHGACANERASALISSI
jgi:hypothetical protein